jgi:hypothetical protein
MIGPRCAIPHSLPQWVELHLSIGTGFAKMAAC